jgi:hypothetical protein
MRCDDLTIDAHDTLYVCDNSRACVRIYDHGMQLINTVSCVMNMAHSSVHNGILYFTRHSSHGYDGRFGLDLGTGVLASLSPAKYGKEPFAVDANGCTVGFAEKSVRGRFASVPLHDAADIQTTHEIDGICSVISYPRIDGRGHVWLVGRRYSSDGGSVPMLTRCSPAD